VLTSRSVVKMRTGTPASKPWADKPLALIPTPKYVTKKHDMWTSGASHMCNVHNAIFRGYNSIYLQAPHVGESDKTAFLGYCRTWCKFVMTHAAEEEGGLFPEAEKLLDENVFEHSHEEHVPFTLGVDQVNYLETLRDASELSSEKMLSLMSAFEQPFEEHFRKEIDVIASLSSHPNSPEEGTQEQITAKAKFNSWGTNSVIHGGISDVLMFFLFNLDRDIEQGSWKDWPEIPGPIRWLLPRTVGSWHSGWWKFASCDANGRRKELYLPRTET
ncbi:hypothetical protein B0T10DRAFT_416052, partial [Thelonectria olida]